MIELPHHTPPEGAEDLMRAVKDSVHKILEQAVKGELSKTPTHGQDLVLCLLFGLADPVAATLAGIPAAESKQYEKAWTTVMLQLCASYRQHMDRHFVTPHSRGRH